jgi:DNA-binding XRE family transcriptional regulator
MKQDLTVQQFADEVGLHRNTVLVWEKRGSGGIIHKTRGS